MCAAEILGRILVQLQRLGEMHVRLRPVEDRAHRVGEPSVGDVHTAWHERVATITRHSDHGRIDAEHMDDRLGDGLQRCLEGKAARKRVRDLIERSQPARGLSLRVEHRAQRLAELLCLLVQASVLHGHRELRRKGGEQVPLTVGRAPGAGEGNEEADRLVVDAQRNRECGLDARGLEHPRSAGERAIAAALARPHVDRLARAQSPRRERQQ